MTRPITAKFIVYTVLLGVIMLAINTVFGWNTVTYLSKETVYGVVVYKIDFWNYIDNIRTTFDNYPHLTIDQPTRTWMWPTNWLDIPTNWNILVNDLAFMLNIAIMGLNATLFPLRVGFYSTKVILALIGIPVVRDYAGNPLEWLIETCNFMVDEFNIPYV